VVFFGLAKPVKTPLIAPSSTNYSAMLTSRSSRGPLHPRGMVTGG
jgi:hypothetical protein